MGIRNTTSRWGALAQLLHWTVVALILVQVALINYADSLPLGMAKLAAIAQVGRDHHPGTGPHPGGLALD